MVRSILSRCPKGQVGVYQNMSDSGVLELTSERKTSRVVHERRQASLTESKELLERFLKEPGPAPLPVQAVPRQLVAAPLFCACCGNAIEDNHGYFHRSVYYCRPCFYRGRKWARFKHRLHRRAFAILVAVGVCTVVAFALWLFETSSLMKVYWFF